MTKIPAVNLSTTLNVFRNRFNRLIDSVGDVASLTTDANTTIVEAINTIDSNLGTRTSLTTNNTTTFVASINEIDSDVGNISLLMTDSNADIVTSINSLYLGKLDSANTQSMIDSNFTDSNRIATIPNNVLSNSQLANNTVTVNGITIALGEAGNIDITDSGTSVALIKSVLKADSDTGIHYDSSRARFSLDKIPNSALGNVTYTINGVTGNLGEPITIQAIDSNGTENILDSAFGNMKRDLFSRQPDFGLTSIGGKISFKTNSELVEFQESDGTSYLTVGSPSGTGNTGSGRPIHSGVVEANKHLLMISDSATIRASDITLTADSNVSIDAEGAIILDAYYQEAKPYNTQGDIHFKRNGTNIVTLEMNDASATFAADNSRALVMTTNNNYFAVNASDHIRLDVGTGGPYVQFRRNNEDRLRFDYTKDGLLDSNSIISYQPLTITTSTSVDDINFKAGSFNYNFYDSTGTNPLTIKSKTDGMAFVSNTSQNILFDMPTAATFKVNHGSGNIDFVRNNSLLQISNETTSSNSPIVIRASAEDEVGTVDLKIKATDELHLETENASGAIKFYATGSDHYLSVRDTSNIAQLESVEANGVELLASAGSNAYVRLTADAGILLQPDNGSVYFRDGTSDRALLDATTFGAPKFYVYTASGFVLNTTWEQEDMIVQGDITTLSDERTKENIESIDGGLDIVESLRGVYYNKIGEQKRKVGVIAQEVEQVLPEVVLTDQGGMKSVDYGKIVGVLIEAIKDLKSEIDDLKHKIGE